MAPLVLRPNQLRNNVYHMYSMYTSWRAGWGTEPGFKTTAAKASTRTAAKWEHASASQEEAAVDAHGHVHTTLVNKVAKAQCSSKHR